MPKQRVRIGAFLVGITALGAGLVFGQNYPDKPIRIVTSGAGGGLDVAARLIATGLTARVGKQVIVENREGASGGIAAYTVARASPDGYTLLLYGSPLWILPLFGEKVQYDPIKDFAPITVAVSTPNLLVVHPSVAANSVKELIALAKARPGELNYASGASGATPHVAAELFKAKAGVNIVRIPYKGTAPAVNDLIGGRVQLMFANASTVMPNVKSGKLRALAVTSAQPSAQFPTLPTVAASGLPGYEVATVYGVFAPAKTPPALIDRLNREIVQALHDPELQDSFVRAGIEPVGSTPERLAVQMKAEIATIGSLIRNLGIRAD